MVSAPRTSRYLAIQRQGQMRLTLEVTVGLCELIYLMAFGSHTRPRLGVADSCVLHREMDEEASPEPGL
jgi:hypothetical protein